MARRLLAEHTFPYAGGTVTAGQTFEAQSDFDALALIRAGHAVLAPDQADADPPIPPRRPRRPAPVTE